MLQFIFNIYSHFDQEIICRSDPFKSDHKKNKAKWNTMHNSMSLIFLILKEC